MVPGRGSASHADSSALDDDHEGLLSDLLGRYPGHVGLDACRPAKSVQIASRRRHHDVVRMRRRQEHQIDIVADQPLHIRLRVGLSTLLFGLPHRGWKKRMAVGETAAAGQQNGETNAWPADYPSPGALPPPAHISAPITPVALQCRRRRNDSLKAVPARLPSSSESRGRDRHHARRRSGRRAR
jgi:hypothetical protein